MNTTLEPPTEWHDVGTVAVDSGHLWLGDPCHVLDPDERPRDLGKSWDDMVPKIVSSDAAQWFFDGGNPGLGVTVKTGDGDGLYPVRVKRSPTGKVEAVLVQFIPEAR